MKESRVSGGIRWAGALLIVALVSAPLHAQVQPVVQWVFVKNGPLAAMKGPTHESGVIALLPAGTWLEVVDALGDWYRVLLPRGAARQGERSAWVPASLVARSSGPPGSPLIEEPAGTARTPAPVQTGHRAASSPGDRYFIAVNGAMQERSLTFQDSRTEPFYAEDSSWTARYGIKSGYGFDAGLGVRLWRGLAAGVAVSRFEDAGRPAAIDGAIPHPFHFDRRRGINGETESLKHVEQAVHVSAAWLLPPLARFRLSLFGGPSFFSVSRDLVADVEFSETYPYNTASYERALVRGVSGSRTGFHAGVDVAWSLTRRLGVGAIVRYARADLVLDSPAHGRGLAVEAGGVQAGAGLRVSLAGGK